MLRTKPMGMRPQIINMTGMTNIKRSALSFMRLKVLKHKLGIHYNVIIGATRFLEGGKQNYLFKITHRGLASKSIKDICYLLRPP